MMNPWSYTASILAPLDPNNTFDWKCVASHVCSCLPVPLEGAALGHVVDLYTDVQRAIALPRRVPASLPAWARAPVQALCRDLGLRTAEACYVLGRALHRANQHVLGVPRLPFEEVPVDYASQPLLSRAEYDSVNQATDLPPGSAQAWLPCMVKTGKAFYFCTAHALPCPGAVDLLHRYFAPAHFTFALVTHHDMVDFDRPFSHTLSIITE